MLELEQLDRSEWRPLFQYLDKDGDGTGTKQATEDYSDSGLGLTKFFIKPPANQIYVIERMIIYIQDAIVWQADHYGKLGTALTNGISVLIRSNKAAPYDLTAGIPITTNGGWKRVCHDAPPSGFGAGDDNISVRWTFRHSGRPIVLRGSRGEQLDADLNDDLSGLSEHTFHCQGYSTP